VLMAVRTGNVSKRELLRMMI